MIPTAVALLFGGQGAAKAYSLLFNAFGVASLGGVSLAKSYSRTLGWEAVYRGLGAAALVSAALVLRLDV